MKKISIYMIIACLIGVSSYAGITATRATDTFAENALKTGSFPLEFVQEATNPWEASNGYVVSTNKTPDSEVGFSATFNLSFRATVSFEWAINGDELIFYVDGNRVNNIWGNNSNYQSYSYDLAPGQHTLKWSYKNSNSPTAGDDRGYVKNIYIDPTAFVMPGIAYPVCPTEVYFGNIAPNSPSTKIITVRNIGSEQLNIDDVAFSNAMFVAGNYTKAVSALGSIDIPVTLTASAEGMVSGTATLNTVNGGIRTIQLSANCVSSITTYTLPSQGTLHTLIPSADYENINALKLNGEFNDDDIAFIKLNLINLQMLDLQDASTYDNRITSIFESNTFNTVVLPKNTVALNGYAFRNSVNLQTVVLPDGLISIDYNAFENCSMLEDITLPTTLQSIASGVFYNCASIKKMAIPDGVLGIDNYTFGYCTSLEEFDTGNGVATINTYETFTNCPIRKLTLGNALTTTSDAFQNNTNLEEVSLGDNITIINSYAFRNCTSLTTINISDKIIGIGEYAFAGCESLANISLPNNFKVINRGTFEGCTSLTSFVFPDSLTTIGEYAFNNTRLAEIDIQSPVNNLPVQVFGNNPDLKTIVLGDSIKAIASHNHDYNRAFYLSDNIETVTIGNGLTMISEYLFADKRKLKSISLGDGLRSIDSYAFYNCELLSKVTLPSKLQSIGWNAFSNCTSLTSFVFPDSLTTIGEYAFNNTRLAEIDIQSPVNNLPVQVFGNNPDLKTIVLGDSIKAIASHNHDYNRAFYLSDNIETVTIGNGLTMISEYLFADKRKLKSISLGDGLRSIDSYAFYNCELLSKVTLPSKLQSIGWNAFSNCTSLTSFVFPDSLSSIGEYAFNNTRLAEIDIQSPVNNLPVQVFGNNPDLKTIVLGDSIKAIASHNHDYNRAFYLSDNIETVTIGNGLTMISEYLFADKRKLKSITIGDNLRTIDSYAFLNCTVLSEVNIPTVETIGYEAFRGCTSLRRIPTIDRLKTLSNYVFAETGIDTLQVPAVMADIPEGTFYNCDSLRSIVLDDVIKSIGYRAFESCDSVNHVTLNSTSENVVNLASTFPYLRKISFGDAIVSIPDNLLSGKKQLEEVTFGSNLTTIGQGAFSDSGLKTIMLPNQVTTLGNRVFADCQQLTSIQLGTGITTLPEETFVNCLSLKRVDIPANVEEIGNRTFYDCDSLRTVTLSASLTKIGNYAFAECDTLSQITFGAGLKTIGSYAFSNCRNLSAVQLPNNLTAIGPAAFNATSITALAIPDSIASISDVFAGMQSKLTSVTLGKGVKEMPESVFSGFAALKEVRIGEGLLKVPNSAFWYCSALSKVTIGSNVTDLDAYSFGYCISLTEITIPDKVVNIHSNAFYGSGLSRMTLNMEEIKDYAFNGRSDLTSVVLGTNVKRIGIQAFSGTGISEIALPAGLTTIKDRAFTSTKIGKLTIPSAVTSIGEQAFSSCGNLESVTVNAAQLNVGKEAFSYNTRLKNVVIGAGSVNLEARAFTNNDSLATVVFKEGGVKNIGDEAFYNTKRLSQVTLASVDTIGVQAFAYCESLKKIHIVAKVIKNTAFYENRSLEEVTFAEGLLSIGASAFTTYYNDYPTAFKKLTFPNSLVSIADNAFNNNVLTEISFGSGLKSIGERAFYNSSTLTQIVLPNAVETIGRQAFSNSTNVRSISLGNALTEVQTGAFGGTNELMAIHWGSDLKMEDDLFNPATNCLFYVTAKTDVPQKWTNVIRDGVADSISITNEYTYSCEKAFKAKKIVFTKNFSLETGRGESKGWETLVLPFDATDVQFGSRKLVPFGGDMSGGATPFWLRKLDSVMGFTNSSVIKAFEPYIIAVPNHYTYDADYNVVGNVQFIASSASGIDVPVTTGALAVTEGPSFDFVPTFNKVEQSMEVYALNTDWRYTDNAYGSMFERDKRTVNPFEAYVMNKAQISTAFAPALYSIGGNGDATGLGDMLQSEFNTLKVYSRFGTLYIESDCERVIQIYNTNGMLVRVVEVSQGLNSIDNLTPAIYFLEGHKVLIEQM